MVDPLDTEAGSKLSSVERQTRNWMYDFLSKCFSDTTGLLPATFAADTFPKGSIRGSLILAGSSPVQREIAQGSIQGADIADQSIPGSKLAIETLTNDHIAPGSLRGSAFEDGSIPASKLMGGLVSGDKLQDGSVTNAKLGALSVTGDKIANEAVAGVNIAARAITGDKIQEAAEGYMLVGGNTVGGVPNCFAPKKLSGALTVDSGGVVSLIGSVVSAHARIIEEAAQGTDGGGASATTWNKRGVKIPWKVRNDPSNLIDVDGYKVYVRRNGTYLIFARAPGYKVTGHRASLTCYYNAGVTTQWRTFYGTCEYSNSVNPCTTVSQIIGVVTVTGAADPTFPYFLLEHYTQAAEASDGLGKAVNITDAPEVYAEIDIFKIA
jgi:hypothetical protein